jgi:hypothetical protein
MIWRRGPRFGVVGNCQAPGLAQCLERLVPGATTHVLTLTQIEAERSQAQLARWCDRLAACDVVFSTPITDPRYDRFTQSALRRSSRAYVPFPAVVFTGFHPDSTYVPAGHDALRGPMGVYHSALTVACHHERVPPARVPALFNAYSYATLGYFDDFEHAATELTGHAGSLGYDLARFLDGPVRPVFMHSFNHPSIAVIAAIAEQALAIAGIRAQAGAADDAPDALADLPAWPVYPEIGRRLGTPSSLVFQRRPGTRYALPEFIAASYAVYDRHPALPTDPRIERARQFLRQEMI